MILFFLLPVLVIAIIILVIKYIKINANVLSHNSFDREARRKAKEWKHSDPVISCDYCGAKIDTKKHKTCPACGAPYDMDEEWLRRNQPDTQWADEKAEETYDEKINEAAEKSAKTAKRLKIAIIVLLSLMVFFVIMAFIIKHTEQGHDYAKEEPLNSSYSDYVEASYEVVGDGVVFENDSVKITITNIYENQKYGGSAKIEYEIENKRDADVRLIFSLVGINGISDTFDYYYEWLKAGKTYTQYTTVRAEELGDIEELIFSHFLTEVDGESTAYIYDYSLRKITTTGSSEYVPAFPEEAVDVFENDNVRIASGFDSEYRRFHLYFENKSGYDYIISTSNTGLINNQPYSLAGIYDEYFPAGYMNIGESLYAYNESYERVSPDDDLKISVTFSCNDDPSKSFSTGYFELK